MRRDWGTGEEGIGGMENLMGVIMSLLSFPMHPDTVLRQTYLHGLPER